MSDALNSSFQSLFILRELSNTLERPYFRRQLSTEEIAATLDLLVEEDTLTPLVEHVSGVATHSEDDLILAATVSAQVHYLDSGDTKLQAIGTYQGIAIIAPRAFLSILDLESDAVNG